MPPSPSLPDRLTSLLWTGFKMVVLVVGGAIAFMPDELRPVAWRLAGTFFASEVGTWLLLGLGAVLACFVVLLLVGHRLMPDEPEPR